MINQRPNPQVNGEVIVSAAELRLIERLADVGRAFLAADEAIYEREAAQRRRNLAYAAAVQVASDRARSARGGAA